MANLSEKAVVPIQNWFWMNIKRYMVPDQMFSHTIDCGYSIKSSNGFKTAYTSIRVSYWKTVDRLDKKKSCIGIGL